MKNWTMAFGLASLFWAGCASAQQPVDNTTTSNTASQNQIRQERLDSLGVRRSSDSNAQLEDLRRRRNTDRQERLIRQAPSSQRSEPVAPGGSNNSVVRTQ